MKGSHISKGIDIIIENDLYSLKETVNNYLAKYDAKIISVSKTIDNTKYYCILER